MLNYCIFFRFWFYVWKLSWWQFGIWARYEINDRIYRDYGRTLWGTAISHFYETLCASILGGKFLLKDIYSEKATKFATIFHFSLTLISTYVPSKKWKILSNVWANFMMHHNFEYKVVLVISISNWSQLFPLPTFLVIKFIMKINGQGKNTYFSFTIWHIFLTSCLQLGVLQGISLQSG